VFTPLFQRVLKFEKIAIIKKT